jgi:FkbM family methyltransferase
MSSRADPLAERMLGHPLVLYGAGRAGRVVAKNLGAKGVQIHAFLDQSAQANEFRDGIPVFNLAEWSRENRTETFNALVSIYNPQVDVKPIIEQLRELGFAHVLSMVDYVNFCPNDGENRLWLVPSSFYVGKNAQLAVARALLSDDLSRVWFDASVRLRQHGDFCDLPTHTLVEQYTPTGLPQWSTPLRLIDCGAFNGDTIQAFLTAGYQIEAAAAFEPDPDNYATLSQRHGSLNGVFFPCGTSDSARQVRFEAGQGASSRIDEGGSLTIQCVSIDQALPGFAPNLIKMDIEGAELATLRGAERTLRKHRPSLAVCIYHKPSDLWEIPLWIGGLGLGYKMYLRGHGPCGFDLVLYCRAQ